MSHEALYATIHLKRFYVRNFRALETLLIVSYWLNIILVLSFFYVYINRPDPDFYSTNGVVAPESLTPMDIPNETSAPLLPDDPPDDDKAESVALPE